MRPKTDAGLHRDMLETSDYVLDMSCTFGPKLQENRKQGQDNNALKTETEQVLKTTTTFFSGNGIRG